MNLTARFGEAVQFALTAHAGQLRKGTPVPYAAHLLAVAGIVLDYGGDEDQAIAALLHDCIEDCGIDAAQIRARFGDAVAGMVVSCSDSMEKDPSRKPPWLARKKAYLEHLQTADGPALLVSTADKLHNARSILRDFRKMGDRVWERFKASKEETLWYYDALVRIFQAKGAHKMLADELSRTVADLRGLAQAPPSADCNGGGTAV